MATLADSFLAEFNDLFIDENYDEKVHKESMDAQAAILHYNNLEHISKFQKNQHFHDTMKKVDDAMLSGPNSYINKEDDSENQLIVDCSTLVVAIDDEITIIHNFIRDKYRNKFPELESLVLHPIDYSHIVKQIGNEIDLTLVDLKNILPSSTIMVVCVTASTTRGKPLLEEDLEKTIDACDQVLALDKSKKHLLDFLENRLKLIAPNLSAIVGSTIAAKLISDVGGLAALTKIPACNLETLGARKKNLDGFSTTRFSHRSFVFQSKLVQSSPPPLQLKARCLVANKCSLAARIDYARNNISAEIGEAFQKVLEKKIEKWQELPPRRHPKPLLVPDSAAHKKKRGGHRSRKMKEKYALTKRQKLQNLIKFGVQEESSLGDGLGRGYGMLGQDGSGELQVSMNRRKLVAKFAKKVENGYNKIGDTQGFSSSLTFTPLQGIDLVNPQAQINMLESGTQSIYFSDTKSFSKVE